MTESQEATPVMPADAPATESPARPQPSATIGADPLLRESLLRAKRTRFWSRLMLATVGISIVATIARVAQLKTDADPRLTDAMLHNDGTPIQYLRRAQPQPRGTIFDRRGQVIAMDVPGHRLYIDPRHVYREAMKAAEKAQKDHDRRVAKARRDGTPEPMLEISLDPFGDAIAAVANRLGENPQSMLREVTKRVPAALQTLRANASDEELAKLPRYVVLKKDLTDGDLEAMRGMRVAGVTVEEMPVREYPFENRAASLVGLVGTDHSGLGGLEHRFEKTLDSDPGSMVRLVDNRKQTIAVPSEGFNPGKSGEPIQVSIDMNIQAMVEDVMDEFVANTNAAAGRCVLVDVDTGEILAMYDTLRTHTGRSPIAVDKDREKHPAFGRNRCVTDPYEPGSTFKPFVWSWVTKLGKLRPESRLDLPSAGGLVVRDGRASRLIRDVKYYGPSTWKQVLERSQNAGMATAAMKISKSQMQEALATFGFGFRTKCGLPGETAGIITSKKAWTMAYTQCSVAIGQEIGVTPVQMVRAFTAFCRDGSIVDLTLNRMAPNQRPTTVQALPEPVALMTRDAMRGVLTEGTGRKAEAIAKYEMFGKSGTAQLPKKTASGKNIGYYEDRYVSSFIAAAPFKRPRIAVVVVIEDPDKYMLGANRYGGGAIAGPAAAHITNAVLEYMGIPPERTEDTSKLAAAH
jgi:cell division protein FtsI (penicillin-binding protein 3)